jgi:class 3 adenylate cyclase
MRCCRKAAKNYRHLDGNGACPTIALATSVIGTKRTWRSARLMSAIGGKADIEQNLLEVCFLTHSGHSHQHDNGSLDCYNGRSISRAGRYVVSSERVKRRLAAVLAADVAGYSRLMGRDEEGTLAQLKSFRKSLVDPAIAEHGGRIVKTTGDGMLVEFASAVGAACCAIDVQRGMAQQNADVPQDVRIELRVGIHVGDIIIDENDIFGDGVNIAARLEGIAEPGGVCISDDAQRQIRGKVDIGFDDMGLQTLKNIAEPMHAWRMQIGAVSASSLPKNVAAGLSQPLSLPDKPSIAVLPFQNMSGDPEQEYFADGIVEDIITALSHFKSLFVIARNSSFTYKGKAADIKQVGVNSACAMSSKEVSGKRVAAFALRAS